MAKRRASGKRLCRVGPSCEPDRRWPQSVSGERKTCVLAGTYPRRARASVLFLKTRRIRVAFSRIDTVRAARFARYRRDESRSPSFEPDMTRARALSRRLIFAVAAGTRRGRAPYTAQIPRRAPTDVIGAAALSSSCPHPTTRTPQRPCAIRDGSYRPRSAVFPRSSFLPNGIPGTRFTVAAVHNASAKTGSPSPPLIVYLGVVPEHRGRRTSAVPTLYPTCTRNHAARPSASDKIAPCIYTCIDVERERVRERELDLPVKFAEPFLDVKKVMTSCVFHSISTSVLDTSRPKVE